MCRAKQCLAIGAPSPVSGGIRCRCVIHSVVRRKNVLGTGWAAWDIAAFTTFISCFTKLTVRSSKVAKLFNSVQKAEVSWKRIKPLMWSPEPLETLRIPQPADVTIENLSFAYGEEPVFPGFR